MNYKNKSGFIMNRFIKKVFLALPVLILFSCENFLWPIKDFAGTFKPVSTSTRTITIPGASSDASFVMIDIDIDGGTTDEIILGEDLIEVPYRTTVKEFSLARYETSYNTWYEVLQWANSHGYTIVNKGVEGVYCTDAEHSYNMSDPGSEPKLVEMPVCGLTWRDAMVWCNALSEMCGRTPVYYTDSNFKTPIRNSTGPSSDKLEDYLIQPGQVDNPYVNKDADGFRLAYREEWEYAARKKKDGGFISGRNVSGDDSGAMFSPTAIETMNGISFPVSKVYENYMWWRKNSNGQCSKTATGQDDSTATLQDKMKNNSIGSYRTHLSGGKLPNHLGFYDLSGNVPEWCFDYNTTYGSTYKFHTMRSFKGGDQVNESYTGNPSHCSGNTGGQLVALAGGFRIAQNKPM
ncbi:MAG: formylglycine-generating enzyme family protein [Treponema sp.]